MKTYINVCFTEMLGTDGKQTCCAIIAHATCGKYRRAKSYLTHEYMFEFDVEQLLASFYVGTAPKGEFVFRFFDSDTKDMGDMNYVLGHTDYKDDPVLEDTREICGCTVTEGKDTHSALKFMEQHCREVMPDLWKKHRIFNAQLEQHLAESAGQLVLPLVLPTEDSIRFDLEEQLAAVKVAIHRFETEIDGDDIPGDEDDRDEIDQDIDAAEWNRETAIYRTAKAEKERISALLASM